MNISTVFFDLGNTLLHNHYLNDSSIRTACRKMAERFASLGYHVDIHALAEQHFRILNRYYNHRDIDYIEQSAEYVLRQTLEIMGFDSIPEKDIFTALASFYSSTQENWKLTPFAVETLETLTAQKKKIGLITNASYAEDIRQLLSKHRIGQYFSQIIISAEAGYRKPRKEIFNIALAGINSKPEESVMIGDSLSADIYGAKQNHMAAIWFKQYASTTQPEIQRYQPDAVINELSEIPAVIQKIETS